MSRKARKTILTPSRLIIFGFLLVILCGTLLLMLPFATTGSGSAGFLDALFTAVSATCVTGLVTQNTATYWTYFGQAVILIMIQIGGMGVVTVTISLIKFAGKKIGLRQRSLMQESISAPQVGGIIRLLGMIIRVTFAAELLGAVLLYPFFYGQFGPLRSIWLAVFHSISAFCNAGFDLLSVGAPFASMTSYSAHLPINIIIMLLIITGGIGFLTWSDVKTHKWRVRRYKMQTKAVLCVTAVLILLPAIYFYFVEFSALAGKERILGSLFQTVTLRTAGFNTLDLNNVSGAGQLLMIILMLIGGSTGSTAGGMKVTTVAVLFALSISVFRRKNDATMFGRRLEQDTIKTAATILMMYLTLFLSGGLLISLLEGLPILTALFESASAIGTVGLSLGITSSLGAISKIILMALMFCGRVGGLTLIFAAAGQNSNISKLPSEKITVG